MSSNRSTPQSPPPASSDTPEDGDAAKADSPAPTGPVLVDYRGQVSAATRRPHIGFRIMPTRDGAPGHELVLRPGVQPIPADRWAEVDKRAREHLTASGQLVVLPSDFSIGKVTPADALSMIERTTVPELLREWADVIDTLQGDLWKPARERLAKQITAVTTDVHGNPATQRQIVVPATAHG